MAKINGNHPLPRHVQFEYLRRIIKYAVVTTDPDGCIQYTKGIERNGYSRMMIRRKRYGTHRLAYMVYHKHRIPNGRMVCHTCDNSRCINPKHLFLGDATTNQIDCMNKGRNPHAKLTQKEVRDIRTRSLPIRLLGKIYGVCHKTIWEIKQKRRWAYVE